MVFHMGYVYDGKKATQLVAFVLEQTPSHSCDVLAVQKLLYIADRESIRETGFPISGARTIAMQHGPVLSEILDLMKLTPDWVEPTEDEAYWIKNIERKGNKLHLLHSVGTDRLSRADMEKLKGVYAGFGRLATWELRELTHGFPEWVQNEVGNSSAPIPLEDILAAVGREEDLEQLAQARAEQQALVRFFSGAECYSTSVSI